MLYWVTATAASSARLYWESFGPKRRTPFKVTVPTGVAVFPKEIVTPVRKWMEASYTNIQHWNEMPKGGHFAAFEQPDLFVREVRDISGRCGNRRYPDLWRGRSEIPGQNGLEQGVFDHRKNNDLIHAGCTDELRRDRFVDLQMLVDGGHAGRPAPPIEPSPLRIVFDA